MRWFGQSDQKNKGAGHSNTLVKIHLEMPQSNGTSVIHYFKIAIRWNTGEIHFHPDQEVEMLNSG